MKANDERIASVIMFITVAAGLFGAYVVGVVQRDRAWKEAIVRRGLGEYDGESGEWKWKEVVEDER